MHSENFTWQLQTLDKLQHGSNAGSTARLDPAWLATHSEEIPECTVDEFPTTDISTAHTNLVLPELIKIIKISKL
jgi:hypothetical protein